MFCPWGCSPVLPFSTRHWEDKEAIQLVQVQAVSRVLEGEPPSKAKEQILNCPV